MFGLDNTSGVSVMPPIADKMNSNPLWFTEGGGGIPASYPGADWFNAIQAEFLNLFSEAGITPNKSTLNQLASAVKALSLSSSASARCKYNNLVGSASGASSIASFWSDETTLSDSSGNCVILRNSLFTINLANIGLNGLDTGSLSSSKWYSCWAIYNKNNDTLGAIAALCPSINGNLTVNSNIITGLSTTGNLRPGMPLAGPGIQAGTVVKSVDSSSQITISTQSTITSSSTALSFCYDPVLPDGYTYKLRISMIRTDSTTNKYPLSFIQFGNHFQYKLASPSNLSVFPTMASGSQGSPSVPTWVSVAVGNFVPPTAIAINVCAHMATYTKGLIVAPNSSYGGYNSLTSTPQICMSVTSGNESNGRSAVFSLESSNIYYACDDSAYGNLVCLGWDDSL